MNKTHYFLVSMGLLLALFVSCKSDLKKSTENKKHYSRASLLNLSALNNDFENEISFPIWFNDSLVKANYIQGIERKIYPRLPLGADRKNLPLKEKLDYSFDNNGMITSLVHNFYVDLHSASSYKMIYSKNRQFNDFSKVKVQQKSYLENDYGTTNILKPGFHTYKVSKTNSQYSIYSSMDEKSRIIIIEDTILWNVLALDRLFKPKKTDRIVFGTLSQPIKTYSVENKINESNIYLYKYVDGGLTHVEHLNYPFLQKRNFNYDSTGHCTSYIDSNFVDNNLLFLTRHSFERDSLGFPINVFHERINILGGISYSYQESFEYQFLNKRTK
ncbi:MAG: hypothetical protein ACI9XP_000882 [Lentimonas sp.]|jgi:hypothetical protein